MLLSHRGRSENVMRQEVEIEEVDAQEAPASLREAEQHQVQERAAPRAVVVYETIRREGLEELRRPSSALAWSGLAAGLSMGFSLVAQGLIRNALPDAPWRPLLVNLGYSIGFLIVILGRQQLFTENTLTPIIPLLRKPSRERMLDVARLWAVVLATNLAGALLFALAVSRTDIFDAQVRQDFMAIGREVLRGSFVTTMLRAIFAGWLIALMVWLLPFAENARVWVIILITYVVGLGRLSHSIAGAVETLYLVTSGTASWGTFFLGFLIPTLLGNTIGGVSLVAALNHAQVVAGEGNTEE